MDLAVAKVVEKYRRHAAGYDASARRTMALREKVVGLLGLVPGDTVLDVACGTGLSLPLLRNAVGPSGRVIGVEVSPDMLALARARIYGRNWDNVTLIESAMEQADLGGAFDAALFNYTHDVMQSPRALERTFSFAKRGARVAIAGIKHPPHWLFPLRLWRLLKARPYVTNLSNLDRPWSRILSYVPDLQVEPVMLGTNYLARGTVR
jgi:arsenite methyltransferase